MQQPNSLDMDSPYSPSFNTFFNSNIADVAARVTNEFNLADEDDDFSSIDVHGEDTFEFNLSDSVPAEGDFRPVYPVFSRDLLRGFDLVGEVESRPSNHKEESTRAQIRLKNLFLEDRHPPSSSSSSSEADDLERIPPGTYCVWAPNKSPSASPSPGRCTKSSSTGSSPKSWSLRDLLLNRSKSDGKDEERFVMFLTPKKKAKASGAGDRRKSAARGGEKNKWRSFLPYKQDLIGGFFVSPQALRKSPPRVPIFR